ncbi:MAG: DUF4097 domain-containing protein [Clostridia bacterium]|nr:DUF4097 domain-containing protein [Clostridia bacterium]
MFDKLFTRKNILILVAITVISFSIAGVLFITTDASKLFDEGSKNEVNIERSFQSEGVRDVKIDVSSADVRIIPVEEKDIKVHLTGWASKSRSSELKTELKDGRLVIEVEKNEKFRITIFSIVNDLTLNVYMPKAYSENLKVNTVSGNVYLDKFSLKNLECDTVSGNIRLDSVVSKAARLNTVSGEGELEDCSGDLDFKSVSGGLDARYNTFSNNIKADTTSGDVQIKLPESAEFEIKYDTMSGDYESDFPVTVTGKGSNSGFRGYNGSDKNKIEVNTVSGNLNVYR